MPEEMLDNTLTSAISKAVEVHKDELLEAGAGKETEEKTEAEGSEKVEASETEPPVKDATPEEDDDAVQGKLLLKALRDPKQAPNVINFLATQAGYTKQNIQTKDDVRDAKKDLNEILERNLGEEFKFLAPKLGPAIRESLESLLEDNNQSLRARLEKQELKEIQKETAATHEALAKEWFGSNVMPDNVIKHMSASMDDFPPTDPNMSADKYYRKIFSLTVGELGLTKKAPSNTDKAKKNAEDSVVRNLSAQNRGVAPDKSAVPRKLSLKDAVSLALEQVEQASKK